MLLRVYKNKLNINLNDANKSDTTVFFYSANITTNNLKLNHPTLFIEITNINSKKLKQIDFNQTN